MMKNILVIGLCGLCIQPASAVYFDSIIYDMDGSKDFISRPIVNDTKNNNLYTISAYKISRPPASAASSFHAPSATVCAGSEDFAPA